MIAKTYKNEGYKSASNILLSKIDIKAGDMSFGQRIEIGKILQDTEKGEVQKFKEIFKCLHDYEPKPTEYGKLVSYLDEIIIGIKHWIDLEATLLKYEPTSEEMQAGINELSEKIGEFGTIKALAKTFGKDPDEILEWKYAKVFGILYTDLEEHKFQMRYNKVIERKYKA